MSFFNEFERSIWNTLSDEELDICAKNITEDFNKYFNGKRKILDYKEVKSYIKSIIDGAEGDEENFRKHVHVVYAEEDERRCSKCKGSGVSMWDEPCVSCIATQFRTGEFHPKWEPKAYPPTDIENLKKAMNDIYGAKEEEKSKGCIDYSDTVFKTESDRKIDHINERVESIQANVLEYGNNAITKIIGIKDQLEEQNDILHNFDTRIDEIDENIDRLKSQLKDIKNTLESINHFLMVKDFDKEEEIPKPKWPNSPAKFKVGDLVRLTSGTKIFEVIKVKEENYGGKLNYRYRLKSVDHGYFQYCPQSYLTKVKEVK